MDLTICSVNTRSKLTKLNPTRERHRRGKIEIGPPIFEVSGVLGEKDEVFKEQPVIIYRPKVGEELARLIISVLDSVDRV